MHFPLQQIMLPGDTPLCGGLVFLISKINHGTCHIIGSVGDWSNGVCLGSPFKVIYII